MSSRQFVLIPVRAGPLNESKELWKHLRSNILFFVSSQQTTILIYASFIPWSEIQLLFDLVFSLLETKVFGLKLSML